MNDVRTRTSLKKRLVIAAAAPVVFIIITEIIFRLAGLGAPPPFFVEDPNDKTKILRSGTYREFYGTPPPPIFKIKPANGFRVAIVGESTVAGYPYFYATFSDRLAVNLSDALPDYKCEMINAGLVGWTTFRLLDILDECLQQKPDVVIWMAGHNEERSADNVLRLRERALHPARSIITETIGKLQIAKWLGGMRATSIRTFPPDETREAPHVRDEADLIKEEFRRNVREAAVKIKHSGAKLILTTLPRNARTVGPAGSGHRENISKSDLDKFNDRLKEARAFFDSKDYVPALPAIDAALRVDDASADAHFLRGKILEQVGRPDEARRAFVESIERDFWPSRAREWTQQIIREEAKRSDAPLVDLLAIFDARGNCNVAGSEYLCDDVHPNLLGHKLIADLLLQAIADCNIPIAKDRWRFDLLKDENALRRVFGTEQTEAFADARAIGYARLFESLQFPPAADGERAATAGAAREQLARAHALVPADARSEILLATAEILSNKTAEGVARLRIATKRDRAAAYEFSRIVNASQILRELLAKAGVSVSELAAAGSSQ